MTDGSGGTHISDSISRSTRVNDETLIARLTVEAAKNKGLNVTIVMYVDHDIPGYHTCLIQWHHC